MCVGNGSLEILDSAAGGGGRRAAFKFRRHFPSGINPLHIGQLMRDALVAVDAGCLAGQQVFRVDVGGALRLLGQVHRYGRMAVAAFEAVVRLKAAPFVVGKFQALVEELLARIESPCRGPVTGRDRRRRAGQMRRPRRGRPGQDRRVRAGLGLGVAEREFKVSRAPTVTFLASGNASRTQAVKVISSVH